MAEPSRHIGEHHFAGPVVFTDTVSMPSASITNDSVAAAAGIAYNKTQTLVPLRHVQTGTVAAVTEMVHIATHSGALVSVEAAVSTVATGADRTVTIDVKKSTGGGAFATLLTTTIVLDDDNVAMTKEAGVVSGTNTFIAGDILEFVVTVAGSAGAQASGMVVTAWIYEASA